MDLSFLLPGLVGFPVSHQRQVLQYPRVQKVHVKDEELLDVTEQVQEVRHLGVRRETSETDTSLPPFYRALTPEGGRRGRKCPGSKRVEGVLDGVLVSVRVGVPTSVSTRMSTPNPSNSKGSLN